MNAPQTLSVHTARASRSSLRYSYLKVGGSVLFGVLLCLAVQAAAAHIQDYLRDTAWRIAATRTPPSRTAFGDELRAAQLTTVLNGVSGEMFAPAAIHAGLGRAADAVLSNVSPAAWDRLSAGGCITLTTGSGQTLSFRIVGSHPTGEPQLADALPKIDLSVTTCTVTGEPIAKAVIESERPHPAKSAVGQRAL